MKLSQHGSFDESLENQMREELLAEFAEGNDALDFGACQRADGSIYPIAAGANCRKGRKVDMPSQKIDQKFLKGRSTQKLKAYLDKRKLYPYQRRAIEAELAKRAAPATGLTAAVRSLAQKPGSAGDRGRSALRAKLVARAKEKLVQKDVEQAKAKAERAKAKRQGKAAKSQETPSKQASRAMRDLVNAGNRLDAKAAQSAANRLQKAKAADALIKPRPPAQEGVLKMGVAIAKKGGDPAKIAEAQKALREFRKQQRVAKAPAKAAQEKPSMQINKRFLQKETTQKLEDYLKNRKLYAYQKKAIADELAKRAKGKANEQDTKALIRQALKPGTEGRAGRQALGARVRKQEEAKRDAAAAKQRKADLDDINKQIEQVRKRRQEPAYQKSENKRFLDSLEKGLIRRRLFIENLAPGDNAGARPKVAKPAASAEKIASAKPKQVNQKFLGQPDSVLQAVLRRNDLNPAQRRKIEEELGGRGVTPAKPVKDAANRDLGALRKAGWNVAQEVKGYDPIAVYNRPDNVELASGAFGKAYETKGPPPGVIKQGKIGENEVEVWRKMQATGRAPEFQGAAVSPNMRTVGAGYGGHVKEGNGYLGAAKANGVAVAAYNPRTTAEKNALLEEYIRTRRDMHLGGIAHNDMHAGNIFFDKASGKMQVIDFGLAQPSYKAALMEAFGTNQGDWQSERFIGRYKPTGGEAPAYYRFRRNQQKLDNILQDELGIDTNYMRGMGIRNKPEHIDRVLDGMSETAAKAYLEVLYDGV